MLDIVYLALIGAATAATAITAVFFDHLGG